MQEVLPEVQEAEACGGGGGSGQDRSCISAVTTGSPGISQMEFQAGNQAKKAKLLSCGPSCV